jgi:hypothetical protein
MAVLRLLQPDVDLSISVPNIPGFLRKIFFKIMQHIQDSFILLMARQQTTALSMFGK